MNGRYSAGYRCIAVGLAPLCVAMIAPTDASAANGPYPNGNGIRSLGLGGVSYVAGEESYTLAANPALAPSLKDRYDVGLDFTQVFPKGGFRGNLLGPDQQYSSSFRYIPIPQVGVTTPMADDWSVGMTAFAAGFGTDYRHSPLQRYGGPQRAGVQLAQVGITNVLAWQPVEAQAIGVGLNLSYQQINARGLQPFKLFSADPQHLSDNGNDGAFGIGFTLGWHAYLSSGLEAGVAYTSRTWAQRFKDYAGLLPDAGRLSLPARFGGALALRPLPQLTLALEAQRVLYADEKATGNGIDPLLHGQLLGSDNGPGFGWRSQNIYRIGVAWQCTQALALRGGYSHATQMEQPHNTLITIFAPATIQQHITAGFTYERRNGWQISGYLAAALRKEVRGDNSIPLILGGGEADVSNSMQSIGLSFGRRFQ